MCKSTSLLYTLILPLPSPPQSPHHVTTYGHNSYSHLLSHGLNELRLLSKRSPQLSLLFPNLYQVKSYTYVSYTLRYRVAGKL